MSRLHSMNPKSSPLLGWIAALLVLLSGKALGVSRQAPPEAGTPVLWGRANNEATPPGLTDLVAVEAGDERVVGLRRDGTVVVWGSNGGLLATPPGLADVVAISARGLFQLALRADGRITAWGAEGHVQRDSILGAPEWLTNVVAIEAGYDSSAALTSDGYLVQWGASHLGPLQGPRYRVTPRGFSVGQQFMLVVGEDGRLTRWGNGFSDVLATPASATNLVQAEGGVFGHVIGLRADGRVLSWGQGNAGQTRVPAGASPAVRVAAGYQHSVAVLTDGTAVTWGEASALPAAPLPKVFQVAAGNGFTVGLTLAPVNRLGLDFRNVARGSDLVLTSRFDGARPFAVRWLRDGVGIPGATGPRLVLTDFQAPTLTRFTPVGFNEHGEAVGGDFALQPQDAPPSFPGTDAGTAVEPGAEVVLEAGARGTRPMSYQWYRNGTPIPGANSERLVVSDTATAEVAEYRVDASNAFGSLRSPPRIVAVGLAACVRPPQSVRLPEGMPIRLETRWIAGGQIRFQWHRNGSPVPGATNRELTLIPATAGDFHLVATTVYGVTTSRVGVVRIGSDVQAGPPATAVLWGPTTFGDLTTPRDLTNVLDLAVGDSHAIALLPDGKARMWVSPSIAGNFPPIPPEHLSDVVAVAAGNRTAAAVRRDGTVASWGGTTPAFPFPPDLRGVLQVALGYEFGMALHRDGTVSVWPAPLHAPDGLADVVEIGTSGGEARARRSDGTLWLWPVQDPGRVQRVDSPELRRLSGSLAVMRDGDVERLVDGRWIPELDAPPGTADLADFSFVQMYARTEGAPVLVDRFGVGFLRPPSGLAGAFRLSRTDNSVGALTRLPFTVSISGDTNLATTSDLTLSADVLSSSPVAFQWLRDGAPLPGAGSPGLALRRLRFRDSGSYVLRMSNASGTVASPPVQVSLVGPPEFDPPAPVSADAGTTATLELTAVGTAPITYQWRRDGEPLVGATGSRLVFTNIQAALAGRYELVARNPYGETVSPGVRLSVVPRPPAVRFDLALRELPEGATLALTGSAAGTEPFSYRWLLDGVPIPGQTNASLRIPEVVAGDSGDYRLEVSNPVGTTVSDPVGVRIRPAPPGAESPPRWRLANERSTIEWSAPAHGSPPLRFQWFRDGTPLADATNRTLRLVDLRATDSGSFLVAVSNHLGSGQVVVGELKVLPGPGPGTPIGWGSLQAPADTGILQAVAAGQDHVLGVRTDGTVVGWGGNGSGQAVPPPDLDGVVSVAAGPGFSAALRDDGSVVVWGDVAGGLDRVPSGLRHAIALAAGTAHLIALDDEGRVTVWGSALGSVLNVPATATDVVAVSAGGYGNTVVRRDGRAVSWGTEAAPVAASATNLVSAASTARYSVGLTATGRLLRLGGTASLPPASVTNAIAVAGGPTHFLALRADGTVVGWPSGIAEAIPPSGLSNFVAVAAGRGFSVGLTRAAVVAGRSGPRTIRGDAPLVFTTPVSGFGPIAFQWLLDGLPIPGATNASVRLEPSELRTGRTLALRAVNPFQSWNGPTFRMNVVADVGIEVRSVPTDDFSPLGIRVRIRATGASAGILESWSQGAWRPVVQLGLDLGSAEYAPGPGEESAIYRLRIP